MTTCWEKAADAVNCVSLSWPLSILCVCFFPFGFENWMCNLFVLVPDHYPSFLLSLPKLPLYTCIIIKDSQVHILYIIPYKSYQMPKGHCIL